jgi:hypothetical protein
LKVDKVREDPADPADLDAHQDAVELRDDQVSFEFSLQCIRTKKPIRKQEKEVSGRKPLDNKQPIQGTSGSNREAESTDASVRGGLLRSSNEAG